MTTITLNGALGSRFLAEVEPRYGNALPPPLAALLAASTGAPADDPDGAPAIVVEPSIAEQLAAFVEGVLAEGAVRVSAPPILFSPVLGDLVEIARDVLAEVDIGRKAKPQWACLVRGTRGRLIARRGNQGRIYLLDGPLAKSYAFVRERSMTRVRASDNS